MKKYLLYLLLPLLLACSKDDHYSPDLENPGLLPDKGDYQDEDHGTQALAEEIAGQFSSEIGMIYYDAETRSIPQLYLTRGSSTVTVAALPSGAVDISFERFNTVFMPLQLSVRIKTLLEARGDTLFLRGTDGIIRTSSGSGAIGQPLPESDDGELTGIYVRTKKELKLLIDLMLPIPVKASVEGTR
ncbi:MAG: hypothetical protein P0Y53_12620 [Candidatus Pseudobacter hemicellulosilyticus]|uniref:Uncharacterized protein n=1 Tax=Candidatus Pseudobacter hemicellulosilyticus TaxID=3121375 RepID=A0AAJ6BII1_9BACT|nr:MAG: hypothetical protein P0Y53_12620 [Pseudobacter sp.]